MMKKALHGYRVITKFGERYDGTLKPILIEQIPLIVVDGKELTWREFGRTLLTHEGFQFVFKFIDATSNVEDHKL